MPTVIPRLNRIQPTANEIPSSGRINARAKDQSQGVLRNINSIVDIGDKVGQINQQYENEKIDMLTQEGEREYTAWSSGELAKIRTYKGDPTDAYANYEKQEKSKLEEITNKRPELNERVKSFFTSNMDKVRNSNRIGMLKQRGLQQNVYENNLFESSVKLKKNTLANTAGYIRKDDPTSSLMFDQNIADIKTLVAKRAIENGTAKELDSDAKSWSHIYRDPSGQVVKVQMDNIAKARTAKELNEGISTSIKVLIDSGYTEEAEILRDKYKGFIDPRNTATLARKFKVGDTKNQAYGIVGELAQLHPEDDADKIEAKISSIKDEEVKHKVRQIQDSNSTHRAHSQERKIKKNYETLSSRVSELTNNGTRYMSMEDLQENPLYKETWDSLDAKRKKSITDQIKPPKTTAISSESKIQNLWFGNDPDFDINTITPEEYNNYLSGLSAADRKQYNTRFFNHRSETSSEQRGIYSSSGQFLRNELLAAGHIELNKHQKLVQEDQAILFEAQKVLMNQLDSQYGKFSQKDLKDFVHEYATSVIKETTFNPKPRREFKSTGKLEDQIPKPQLLKLKNKWKKETGAWPVTNSQNFKDYVKQNLNKI